MKIFVKGLEFQGFQGISAEERSIGHRFSMDLTAEVSDDCGDGDEIGRTVDYAVLTETAVELCREASDNTLEAACKRIGNGLLSEFPVILSIRVRLAKLQPALSLSIAVVGVEMEFGRV